MKNFFVKLMCSIPFLGMTACCSTSNIDNTTVKQLDLARYAGKWYELARFDHSFERNLVGCMAEYTIMNDGTVKVVNTGYKRSLDGRFKESVGKARRPDANVPGHLEVSFFLWFYSDYNVLELADDYRYALVGSKSDNYLWILSRTPKMEKDDLMYLLKRAQERGYDTSKLLWVEQKSDL